MKKKGYENGNLIRKDSENTKGFLIGLKSYKPRPLAIVGLIFIIIIGIFGLFYKLNSEENKNISKIINISNMTSMDVEELAKKVNSDNPQEFINKFSLWLTGYALGDGIIGQNIINFNLLKDKSHNTTILNLLNQWKSQPAGYLDSKFSLLNLLELNNNFTCGDLQKIFDRKISEGSNITERLIFIYGGYYDKRINNNVFNINIQQKRISALANFCQKKQNENVLLEKILPVLMIENKKD